MAQQAISISPADTAKLVRKALKQQFPGTKFSVRTSIYAGGASLNVRWTDGPTSRQVQAITCTFEGATFDAMTDLKEYKDSTLDGEPVRFGADFIFGRRDYSVAFIARCAERVARFYGVAMPEITTDGHSAYLKHDPFVAGAGAYMSQLIWQQAQSMAVEA